MTSLPVWAGVLIAVVSYLCIGVGGFICLAKAWVWRDDRRRERAELRTGTGVGLLERDVAAALRPHGGVVPGCFALDRAERAERSRARLRLVPPPEDL